MKHKSSKLRKLESKRTSILTNDFEHCIICKNQATDINEIFMGRNRLNSIKYGLCIPLCRECHNKYHNDRNMQLFWMREGFKIFVLTHSYKEFQDIFKYIKGLDIF
jgi:hypothetical protein